MTIRDNIEFLADALWFTGKVIACGGFLGGLIAIVYFVGSLIENARVMQ